jgi:hypothetical protein
LNAPRTLSNPHTRWYKIGPLLVAGAILFMATLGKQVLDVPPPPTPVDPTFDAIIKGPVGILVNVATFALWGAALYVAWKLKAVSLEGTTLRLKGFREEATVPLHQVEAIEQPWWSQQFARIEFHGETPFGESIWFIPVGGRRGFTEPSVTVTELRALIGNALGDRSLAPPAPLTDYAAEWRTLRRLRAISVLGILGFLGTGMYLIVSGTKGFAIGLLPLLPAVAGMLADWRVREWPCPQCRLPYFANGLSLLLPKVFIRSCRHCGLPRGAKGPVLPAPQSE